MKLYEINQQLERLLELDTERMVDTETGEILTAEDIDQLKMDRVEKIEGCLVVYKNKMAETAAIEEEIKRLTERKATLKNKAEWLKGYVAYALKGEKFETPKGAVSYKKSESVEITDKEKLPTEFLRVVISTSPDKAAIKAAIKAGSKIDGAQVVEHQNVQIK